MSRQTQDDLIEKEVKECIWNKNVIFDGGCNSEYWVDKDFVFPIIAQIINGNETKTNATISKKEGDVFSSDVVYSQ